MADYGIKVSQVGRSVEDAADYELSLSSSFPLLKIEEEGRTTVTSSDKVIYNHDLGYPPFYLIINIGNTSSEYSSYSNATGLGYVGVNNNQLKFFYNGFGSGSADIYYYIFRLPLNSDFESSSVETQKTSLGTIDTDYGIKVSKPGKSINSTDLRDFTLHSGTRSPIVDTVGFNSFNTPGDEALLYILIHNLGYLPLGYSFIMSDDNDIFVPAGWWSSVGGEAGAGAPKFRLGNTSHEMEYFVFSGDGGTYNFSIIVLKDPFDLSDNTINISHP